MRDIDKELETAFQERDNTRIDTLSLEVMNIAAQEAKDKKDELSLHLLVCAELCHRKYPLTQALLLMMQMLHCIEGLETFSKMINPLVLELANDFRNSILRKKQDQEEDD